MDAELLLQVLAGLATLYTQEAPLLVKANAAVTANDETALQGVLAEIQAQNDTLGQE